MPAPKPNEMASLKNLSVRHLRELARKHLGPGHSKLKTRDELLSALKKLVPGVFREASRTVTKQAEKGPEEVAPGKGGIAPESRLEAATKPAGVDEDVDRGVKPAADTERQRDGDGTESPRKGGVVAPGGTAHIRPEAAAPPPSSETARGAGGNGNFQPWGSQAGGNGNGRRRGTPAAAEPLVEGFFVARIAGEMEARRHHLTEDQVRPPLEHGVGLHYDEQLPDIPWEYQDDRLVLLARDPSTLFVYWDFHPDSRRAAFQGLDEPRAVLRVLENGHEVRVIDLALESRSYYVNGLRAGRPYRVELHALARDGKSRRIGPASNDVTLPANEVSSDTTVRFMRVPWGVPLSRLRDSLRTGEAEILAPAEPPEALAVMHARWVPLPSSGSWQLERWIERIPREAPPPGAGPGPHLGIGPYPLGGASSWTLVSSWWSSPSGSSWTGPTSGRGRRE